MVLIFFWKAVLISGVILYSPSGHVFLSTFSWTLQIPDLILAEVYTYHAPNMRNDQFLRGLPDWPCSPLQRPGDPGYHILFMSFVTATLAVFVLYTCNRTRDIIWIGLVHYFMDVAIQAFT